MIVEMILYITLQRAIVLKPCGSSEWLVLGMGERKVEFRARCILLLHRDSSTISIILSPMNNHVA